MASAVTAAPETAAKKIAKKPAAVKKPKSSPAHPHFLSMITEAIAMLKERTGSSQYAMAKFIEEKHKQLPSNFRKLLLVRLKKLVASGQLVKVKASFKTPSSSAPASNKTAEGRPKAKSVAKPKPKKTEAAVPKPKPKAGGATKRRERRRRGEEKVRRRGEEMRGSKRLWQRERRRRGEEGGGEEGNGGGEGRREDGGGSRRCACVHLV